MDRKHTARWFGVAVVVGATALWPGSASAVVDPVSNWNLVAIQATLTAGESGVVASRTIAIAQAAVHDVLNAIDARYERYAFTGSAQGGVSVEVAIAAAARDALVGAISVGALTGVTPVTFSSSGAGNINQVDSIVEFAFERLRRVEARAR